VILNNWGRDMFSVKNAMKTNVVTVKKETPVYDAIRLLLDNHITGLPVVDDDNHLVGIITEKDVLKLLYANIKDESTVEQFMTKNVVTFNECDNLTDIAECFIHNHFRRVPILKNDRLVGILSKKDIIAYILKIKKVGSLEMALQTHLASVKR